MQFFTYEFQDHIGQLGLSRPQVCNAYHQPMLRELRSFLEEQSSNDELRALIIHGGGSRHFCAGADLKEIAQRTCQDGINLLSRRVFEELAKFPKPTIAALHGAALGGGLELALACDLRLGTPDCTLGFPEPSCGLIPAAGGCTRLSLLLGPVLAKEMIIFGRRLSGQEARELHLLAECAPSSELLPLALTYARKATAHDALANALAKSAIDAVWDTASSLEREGLSQALLYELQNSHNKKSQKNI